MWFIQPKRDYVAEMPWRHADEPAVMTWQIRTRDYDIFYANLMFYMILAIATVGAVAVYSFNEHFMSSLLLGGVMFAFLLLVGMSMTHQTAIIVYRLTDKRIEVFSWKPQIDSVKPVMKWTAIISGVGVLCLVLVNPDFIIAAIGPIGIGAMAALMGNSKDYQSMVRNEEYHEIDWPNTEDIAVWRKRRLIGLRFTWNNEDGSHYSVYSKVYCHKKDFEKCLDIFKQRLPDTPYREGKLVVHSHFATLPE
ncbi:hypothetical protein IT895_10455 [Halomonas sp. A40-4]|jgi:hypothetical protein|uniref:hypothetical protein n=1 Tax=Halomonas sp. A40-4 TaxID=2785909 RepID=UPI0018F013E0|nr:hypothetical protein [Halomonas sp. A40-4]QPL44647.1 hypothetical protein IT895_10455 [Halomonas sp. A40-4]